MGTYGKLNISDGNRKIGKTVNISLSVKDTCFLRRPDGQPIGAARPACWKKCYARHGHGAMTSKAYWEDNFKLWTSAPGAFMNLIGDYLLSKKVCRHFRWHVAGEIPSQQYVNMMHAIARDFPEWKFTCYTKRFDLSFAGCPSNLTILASEWPSLGIFAPRPLPSGMTGIFKTIRKEDELQEGEFLCPGYCPDCRECWQGSLGSQTIVIREH